MKNISLRLWKSFEIFWFKPQPLVLSSVFRVLVGFTLVIFYTERLFDFEFLFSDKGLVPYSKLNDLIGDAFKSPLTIFPSSESLLYALHVIFILALVCLALGIGGRAVAFVCWVLHLVFVQRNITVVYGADFVATCWLLYMWLLQTDAYLTLPQLLKKQDLWPLKGDKGYVANSKMGDALNSVGLRFIQIQLCIIYGYSGLEKIKGVTWWRGDAIWNVLANPQLVNYDFSFIIYIPFLVTLMTFSTLMFEVYFPALIWNPKVRPWLLGFGVLLHLGIGLSMNLMFFSLLMIWSYVLFLVPAKTFSER